MFNLTLLPSASLFLSLNGRVLLSNCNALEVLLVRESMRNKMRLMFLGFPFGFKLRLMVREEEYGGILFFRFVFSVRSGGGDFLEKVFTLK